MTRPLTYCLTVVMFATILVLYTGRGFAQTSTWNYIQVKTYAPLTDTAGLGMSVIDQSQTQITYQDGMAREQQSQIQNGSDSVILIQSYYDSKGRKEAVTKPVKSSRTGNYHIISPALLTGNGFSVSNGITDNNALLKQVYSDAFPFERTVYNTGDPLDRVSQVRPFGAVFHQSNHWLRYQYDTDNLKRLLINVQTDENGKINKTYKDLQDRTVKQELVYSADSTLVTEFRYDGLGNLIKSIPPLAVRDSVRKGRLDSTLVTHYWHNSLKQLTDKWSADEGMTEYVYDRLGQLRFVKDANHDPYLNFMAQQSRWTYYKYDIYGRISEQGEFTGDYNKNRLQDSIWPSYYQHCITEILRDTSCFMKIITWFYKQDGTLKWIDTVDIPIDCCNMPDDEIPREGKTDGFTEEEPGFYVHDTTYYSTVQIINQTTCTEQGNSDRVIKFPLVSDGAVPTLINRYDTYGSGWQIALSGSDTSGSCSKTRLTRSKILDPNTSTWSEEAYTYDAYGRVKTKWTYIPELASVKKIQYIYDAAGKILKQSYQPQDANESLYQWFKYDAMGRLDTVFTNRANNFFTAKREAVYDYDDNHDGKVKRMELGGTVQGVDYTYTIRDWLKMINHQNINANDDPGHDGLAGGAHANFTVDRFGMVLSYHESEHGTNVDGSAAQYNGNIRSIIWNSGQGLVGYGFTYDGANRLVNANYKEYSGGWNLTNKFSEKSLQYDANGNILSLTRHLNSSTGSVLNYTYDANKPNRLNKVTGLINAVYEYDNNGNMTRDTTKGYFAYDYRNMPLKVTRNDTTIEYAFDAGGQRTKKTIKKNNSIIDQTIYIRNGSNVLVEYRSGYVDHYNIYGNGLIGKLKPFLNKAVMNAGNINWSVTAKDTVEMRSESRLDAGGSLLAVGQASGYGDKRYYYLSDHLGSIRVVLNESGQVDSWSDYYPFGKEARGSSTSNEPKEQFTGKERDIEIGLDYFGARYYNADVGRWFVNDPMSGMYPGLSPYNYAANNPIFYVDPSGMIIEGAGDEEKKAYDNYKSEVDKRTDKAQQKVNKYEKKISGSSGIMKLFHKAMFALSGAKSELSTYKGIQNELKTMEESSTVYMIRMGSNMSTKLSEGTGGKTIFNVNTNQVDINIGSSSKFSTNQIMSHELKHGYQHETLSLDFDRTGIYGGMFYDQSDEYEALERQNLFGTSSGQKIDPDSYIRKNYSNRPIGPKSFNLLNTTEQNQYMDLRKMGHYH